MVKPKNLARALAIGMLLTVLLSALPLSGPARAATNSNPIITTQIVTTKDSYTDSNSPNTNFGSNPFLYLCYTTCTGVRDTWVFFPLTSIPSNAQVVSAEIVLFANDYTIQKTFGQFDVNFMNTVGSAWSEGTLTWNNAPSGVGPIDSGTLSNSTFGPGTLRIQVRDTVQKVLAGTYTNNGFQIHPTSTGNAGNYLITMWSRDGTRPDSVPLLSVSYQLPVATIYPAYYCSGGPCETGILSGSGLPPTLFNISYSENNGTFRRAPRPDLLTTNISTYFTLRGSDFFGNLLFNQSKVVTGATFLWVVQVPYGIFQVYAMRDTFTSLSIKPAGGTAMLIDIPPRAWWALPLKTSIAYFLNFTLLDGNLNAIATINVVRTMGSKLSFIVNGTTLSQISVNQVGAWYTTNATYGVAVGTGNVLLAPHGFDFFSSYYTLHLGGFAIGLNLWLVSTIVLVVGWGGWGFTYRGKLSRRVRRWPRKAKLIAGFVLLPLTTLLLVALIVYLSGGRVFIPIPWAPALPGFAFVVSGEDPDDPDDDGGEDEDDENDEADGGMDPDIEVSVWHDEPDVVDAFVTLTGVARRQFQKKGGERWLEKVIRKAVRRSLEDPFLRRRDEVLEAMAAGRILPREVDKFED